MGVVGNASYCSRRSTVTVNFNEHLHLLDAADDSRHVHQLGLSRLLFLLCGEILTKTSVYLYELQDCD